MDSVPKGGVARPRPSLPSVSPTTNELGLGRDREGRGICNTCVLVQFLRRSVKLGAIIQAHSQLIVLQPTTSFCLSLSLASFLSFSPWSHFPPYTPKLAGERESQPRTAFSAPLFKQPPPTANPTGVFPNPQRYLLSSPPSSYSSSSPS